MLSWRGKDLCRWLCLDSVPCDHMKLRLEKNFTVSSEQVMTNTGGHGHRKIIRHPHDN